MIGGLASRPSFQGCTIARANLSAATLKTQESRSWKMQVTPCHAIVVPVRHMEDCGYAEFVEHLLPRMRHAQGFRRLSRREEQQLNRTPLHTFIGFIRSSCRLPAGFAKFGSHQCQRYDFSNVLSDESGDRKRVVDRDKDTTERLATRQHDSMGASEWLGIEKVKKEI